MDPNLFIIGLMSGTSLDGLDVAYCRFHHHSGALKYQILAAETIPYPDFWLTRLRHLDSASALQYALADVELGHYLGQCVNDFRLRHPGHVDYISSHGHTIFHQPHLGLTSQIADGDAIAAETRLPVISRFRNLDVALGGQGAPLVPIGDQLLFGNYGACLNLGGFSNISFQDREMRIAFDISPCNMALNHLANQVDKPYDPNGEMARSGHVDDELLASMQSLDYYAISSPKSLGKEWFVSQFLPLIDQPGIALIDKLATVVEHIALQVSSVLNQNQIQSMIVTGGGARNGYLVERIRDLSPLCQIEVPDPLVVDYKEALIFALLGYLRVTRRTNTLRSVTGASVDAIGGTISGLVL